MTLQYHQIEKRAHRDWLEVFGAFHPNAQDEQLADVGTLVLLGPKEPGFWSHFSLQPENTDGRDEPLDRWSHRTISQMAIYLGAQAFFPFGGPPYQPFVAWATRSGRAWQSPVGLLIHDRAGLMLSYRGALALPERLDLPTATPAPFPCDTCENQPCRSACPVDAFQISSYDLDACHGYLNTEAGRDCLDKGCAVRRSCPISQSYGRLPQQSAFHMKAFHP